MWGIVISTQKRYALVTGVTTFVGGGGRMTMVTFSRDAMGGRREWCNCVMAIVAFRHFVRLFGRCPFNSDVCLWTVSETRCK
jgi:hypothetical protein